MASRLGEDDAGGICTCLIFSTFAGAVTVALICDNRLGISIFIVFRLHLLHQLLHKCLALLVEQLRQRDVLHRKLAGDGINHGAGAHATHVDLAHGKYLAQLDVTGRFDQLANHRRHVIELNLNRRDGAMARASV